MRINHNIAALNTYRQLSTNTANGAKSLEKLSSGLRINRAGDDAAGLAISEKMRAQVRGLDQASRNAQDGISMIQTAEGALNETHSILQRMRELADQSANGTNTTEDRSAIQTEITQLREEIDRVGNTTEFNTQKLLNGSLKSAGGVVGQNSTTGGIVAKQTAGTAAMTSGLTAGTVADADFAVETINVDGTEIDVNWAALSEDDKATLKTADSADLNQVAKAKDIIQNTINAAIDASGKNVAHINAMSDENGVITLQSGTEGTGSKIEVTGTGVANTLFGAGTITSGTSTYNGTDTSSTVDMKINGTLLEVDFSGVATAGTDMSAVADAMATAINAAITAYNDLTGKQEGQEGYVSEVSVVATGDGRFQITSPTGPVEFKDQATNTTAKDLGLAQSQTEAAGNGGMTFQIGANKGQTLTFGINDMRSASLGVSGLDVSTATSASSALTTLDGAIKSVSSERAKLGAVQNRLEHTINNLGTSSENLTAAESRVRDVDMAKEMMEFTKNNILSQAAQSMLAQANQQPQGVLQLLG